VRHHLHDNRQDCYRIQKSHSQRAYIFSRGYIFYCT
jgi:hypothetical protein